MCIISTPSISPDFIRTQRLSPGWGLVSPVQFVGVQRGPTQSGDVQGEVLLLWWGPMGLPGQVWYKTYLVIADLNALTYVAGYVVYKIKCTHICSQCSDLLCRTGELNDKALSFMHLKAICKGDFGKLQVPSFEIVRYLGSVEKEFLEILPQCVHNHHVSAISYERISRSCLTTLSDELCSGILDSICQLYLRLRIHAELPGYLDTLLGANKKKKRKNKKLAKLEHL